ncbi:hypothetical protein EVAR_63702_1 [Eumeta japonica]|uniref:Uncharacterized protein n=1 Tax=Eumeta variegata TaxID=151549 RepID=A0A4C1ZYT0_EUMVA|nr:hypothetical protein EVAR_63702_1 [Eumeta japonica]
MSLFIHSIHFFESKTVTGQGARAGRGREVRYSGSNGIFPKSRQLDCYYFYAASCQPSRTDTPRKANIQNIVSLHSAFNTAIRNALRDHFGISNGPPSRPHRPPSENRRVSARTAARTPPRA